MEYALYLRVRDAFTRLSKVSTEVNVSKPSGVFYYNVVWLYVPPHASHKLLYCSHTGADKRPIMILN